MDQADLHFYFDPVCPFCWLTSKWVRLVAGARDYRVDWRFISLRLLNADVDYDAHFPPEYREGHTAGLRLLRVAAAVREAHDREAVGRYYETLGNAIWERDLPAGQRATSAREGSPEFVEGVLRAAGLPTTLARALDDEGHDLVLRAETDEALSLTGKDVGTPILHFRPPSGLAFFGPVISRLPERDEAVRLWDHVVGLAAFPGFAELKRSLREPPQLPALGQRPPA